MMLDNEDPFRPTDDEIAKFKEIFKRFGADQLPDKFKTDPKYHQNIQAAHPFARHKYNK